MMRLSAALIAGSLIVSCAAQTREPPGNVCRTNSDCAGGATCDTVNSRCVAPNATTEVIFVATPPGNRATETATTTATSEQSVSSQRSVDIQLRAPRTVVGRIDAGSAMGLNASVRFHRQGSTPAEPDVEVQSTTMDGFSVQLVPGVYNVTVTPVDITAFPPYLAPLTIDSSASNAQVPLTITYSASGNVVSGRVLDAETQLPMPDVGVRLVDTASNAAIVSTLGTTADGTNGESGSFSVQMSPGIPETWALQLTSQPAGQPDPTVANGRLTYQVSRDALGALQMWSGLTVRASPTFSLSGAVSGACSACVDVQASIEGTNTTGARETLAGATVNLRSDDVLGTLPAGHTAWFEARATTMMDGTFRALLMPGHYTAIITPSRDSAYAITSVHLEVTRSLRGQVLTVNQLVPVLGRIESGANGAQAVQNTLIEAVPLVDPTIATNAAMPVTALARRWQTYTEADGSFLLPCDEGDYLLVAHPPEGSGLATQLFDRVSVIFSPRDGATDPRPTPIPASTNSGILTLSSPFGVTGTVFDSAGTHIATAGVRAFARYAGGTNLTLDVEIARTTSDAAGHYSLLLPSTLIAR